MATPAKLLLSRTFDGVGYPSFTTTWPGFTFPAAGATANGPFLKPVVDGHGRGIPSRSVGGVTWRGIATAEPGLVNFRLNLKGKWQNAGFAGRREIELLFRTKDPKNTLKASVRSMGTASPELRLFKILNGVETQLGPTISGVPGLSATAMNAELEWGVRVEDLQDDTYHTKVQLYLGAASPTVKGTPVGDPWVGDVGPLRGLHGVGVGLTDQVYGQDVHVDDLRVWDLADEWAPSGPPPAPGAGFQVELGGVLYSMDDLAALVPKVQLVSVQQGYGSKGHGATLRVDGDYRLGSVVFPGQTCLVLEGGAVRFRGRVGDGNLKADPSEGQDWKCYSGFWESRHVRLLTDICTGTHHFNVTDKEADEYDPELQGMTGGAIATWLFTRYLDKLRRYGAAPPTGLPYVAEELAALSFVIPDVALSGTFPAAIDALLKYVAHRYQVFWEPDDLVWHFRDTTALAKEVVSCTAEWVKFQLRPDRDRAQTYVECFGARKERDDDVTLKVSDGSLRPIWTQEQAGKYGKEKRNRTMVVGNIQIAATAVAPDGILRPYIDIAAGLLDEGDVRGFICTVAGDAFPRFVWPTNTSTRVWLSPPGWAGGTPPPPGSSYVLTLLSPEAMAGLSAAGVGRGWIAPTIATLCPGYAPGKLNLHNKGFCGEAHATVRGKDGVQEYSQQMLYKVQEASAIAQSAGYCQPIIEVAERPKPPIGLVNYLGPAGSVSKGFSACDRGEAAPKLDLVDFQVVVSRTKDKAPYMREPELDSEGGETFHGPAYSDDPANWDGGGAPKGTDWAVEQGYQLSVPDFTDVAEQGPGLRLAMQDILAVKSLKPILLQAGIASPWSDPPPEYGPVPASTSRFAGLGKRVVLTSALRPTGFHTGVEHLQVYRVTWLVLANETKLEAGTASGWLEVSGVDVAAAFQARTLLTRVFSKVKEIADVMQRNLAKAVDRLGAQIGAPTDACDVTIPNDQVKRITTVKLDDEDKVRNITHGAMKEQLLASFQLGPEEDYPGAPIAVPGLDGSEAQQVARDGSTVLAPLADPNVPFQGPVAGAGGSRGTFGGLIGTGVRLEADDHGKPPRSLGRYGGYEFRKAAGPDGEWDGSGLMEFSPLDAHGVATGPWLSYKTPKDLPGGRMPLKVLGHGSTQHQLLQRSASLARAMLVVQSPTTEELLAHGDADPAYPGGAPPNLRNVVGALAELVDFPVVPETWEDPGGVVFNGPKQEGGADAGLFWRPMVPEGVVARVTPVAPGTGMNGGGWDWDMSAGALEYLAGGRIVHKQAHASDLEQDNTQPGPVTLRGSMDPGHPFLATGQGWLFDTGLPSGLAFTIPVPAGVRGLPMFGAVVYEDPVMIQPPGLTYDFRLDHAYRASPWSPPTPGATQAAVVTDGAGQGTGQFKQPGGAVPPGLRQVSGSVVSTLTGTAPPGSNVHLSGAYVDLAVVEGGFLLRMGDTLTAVDDVDTNHKQVVDGALLVDAFQLEPHKALAEAASLQDTVDVQLNAPIETYEGAAAVDTWGFGIQDLQEAASIADEWKATLNA